MLTKHNAAVAVLTASALFLGYEAAADPVSKAAHIAAVEHVCGYDDFTASERAARGLDIDAVAERARAIVDGLPTWAHNDFCGFAAGFVPDTLMAAR